MTIQLRFYIFLLFSLWLPIAMGANVVPPSAEMESVIEQLEPQITRALKTSGAPGVAVGIVEGNDIVYLRGFGVRAKNQSAKIDTRTVFRIASVSKTFASTLTGVLVEEGILDWQDKVVAYLPTFSLKSAQYTQQLTLHHLLTHTGGLPSYSYDNLVEARVPYSTIVSRLRQLNVKCAPGKCYNYQNVLYSVIGDVLKARTGKTYEQLLQEKLLFPLDMRDTSMRYEAFINHPNHAKPHVRNKKGWTAVSVRPAYYAVQPAGGLNASVEDMAKWLQAQMGARPDVISPHVIADITKPVIETPNERTRSWHAKWRRERLKKAYYARGWRIFDYAGHEMVYHNGGLQGFRSEIAYLPEKKVGIVILWNAGPVVSSTILPNFLDLTLDLPKRDWIQLASASSK